MHYACGLQPNRKNRVNASKAQLHHPDWGLSVFSIVTVMPRRLVNISGFLFCAGVPGYAYYLQFKQDLEPGPLCIFQRIAFICTGLFFLLAALHIAGRVFSRVYAVLIAAASLVLAGLARNWIAE